MDDIAVQYHEHINNGIYETDGARWWHEDNPFYTLRRSVNPVRVGYARRRLQLELGEGMRGAAALEVGCGGGLLTEEIARMGFITTGIDPAEASLRTARAHAQAGGLAIRYDRGTGEALPYRDGAFDVVFCCDVLEHVRDANTVIAEISRVLRPGGSFIFDTFNRTVLSKLVVIKLWQDWKPFAFMEPNAHIWDMFITPDEIQGLLMRNGLEPQDINGTRPSVPLLTLLGNMRKRAAGRWTFKEFGDSFHLVEDADVNIMYLGHAVKQRP